MQYQAQQTAVANAEQPSKDVAQRVEKAWTELHGPLDPEVLEYHRAMYRDGTWRNAYGVPAVVN